MNSFKKSVWVFKASGFSILEALISIVILGIGITAFGKSYTYTVNTNTHIQDQLMSLHMGSEINNLAALHAFTLPDSNPTDFYNRVSTFANQLQSTINNSQKRQNYQCSNSGGEIRPTVQMGIAAANTNPATLVKGFQNSAFSCVSIQVSQSETVNGVPNLWINTRVSWVSRGAQGNEIQSVDSAKLLVGKSLPGQYIKYWY